VATIPWKKTKSARLYLEGQKYPEWVPPKPEPSEPARASVNRTTKSDKTLSLAADGSAIPVVYGRAALGPLYFAASLGNRSLYLGALWCLGEVEGLEKIYDGDEVISSGKVRTNYQGTLTQGVDSDLAYAIEDYEDTLVGEYMGESVGFAYSVLKLARGVDLPSMVAVVQGRKVRDPRIGEVAWSENPALCLADFIESQILGLGRPVNDTSLIDAANFCDEVMEGGSKRATLNLAIVDRAPVDSHIETLRAYAQCWVFQDNGEIFLVPQRPGASVASFSGDNIVEQSIALEQISTVNQPTVVGVTYTDISTWPWKNQTVTVHHPDALTGKIPWRESIIDLPGTQTRSEAYRTAVRRLNYFSLVNLRATFTVFDEGLRYQIGDIVDVTQQWGLTAKAMRVIGCNATSPGRWALSTEEYDEDVYSDVVQTEPDFPDTGLPPVDQVPPVTNLTVAEVLYQTDKGFWSSRLEFSWTGIDDTYVFDHFYRVTVDALPGPNTMGGPISAFTTGNTTGASPPVQEKVIYRVAVRAESSWGSQLFVGDTVSADFTAMGKFLPPEDVPELRVIEAGGEVFMDWDEAIDIDINRYELRYGRVDLPWDGEGVEEATFIDRTDTLRHRTKDIPEGTWDVMVKAIDSVENYSVNATRARVVVEYDPSTSQKARHEYIGEGATLVNMVQVPESPDLEGACWITGDGATWDATLPDLLNNYTEVLALYHGVAGASSWQSEEYNWDSLITGTWSMPVFNAEIISTGGGDPGKDMQLSADDMAWDNYPGLVAKGTYQHSRAYAGVSSGETLQVCVPSVRVEISSTPKTQSGRGYFDGASPTTITLTRALHSVSSIQITPVTSGTSARYGVVDSLVISDPTTFDVYLYDEAAGFVAGDFYWDVKGI
jgi:hypothetical protein